MARIEELPDDFASSLNLSSPDLPVPSSSEAPLAAAAIASTPFSLPEKVSDESTPLPEIPPQMDSVRSHTTDEVLQMMKRTPLFMTSLEDAGDGTLQPLPHNPSVYHKEERFI